MVDKDHAEHGRVHWQEMALIFASGGIGGVLLWLWELWRGLVEWSLGQLAHLPMYIAFGAGAAAVFILLIADSKRSDKARVVALALLAGFAWKPIWTSSQTAFTIPNVQEKWSIDGPLGEIASSTEEGRSGDSPADGYLRFITRFLEEPQAAETEDVAELSLGAPEEIDGQSFQFRVDDEGPLVVDIEALYPWYDLVATLYRKDSDGEWQFVEIDDDSGDRFNPRFDLDRAEVASYLVVLRTFRPNGPYRGKTKVTVSQP